jgi:hypothetical protein
VGFGRVGTMQVPSEAVQAVDFALWTNELDADARTAWLAIELAIQGFTTNEERKGEQG